MDFGGKGKDKKEAAKEINQKAQTKPGAVDDNALKRIHDRNKEQSKLLEEVSGGPY